jgi:hypothetical protein
MSKSTRLVVLGIMSAAALMLSSTAFAAFTSPRLFASQPQQANRVDLLYTQSVADDPVAKLVHHVPVAYQTNFNSGAQVGAAVLRTNTADRVGTNPANSNLVLSGVIEVVQANATFTRGGRQQQISAAAVACTGKAQHTSYWIARLKDAGGDIVYDVPIFVDRLAAATPFGANATISVCFQPWDVAANNPNRAPFGMKVRELDLRLTRIFTSPKRGQQRWSTLVTPYTPRTGRVNQAGTVEVQSVITYPRAVGLANPVRTSMNATSATFRFSGRVSTPPLDRPIVSLFRGANKTQAGGRSANAFRIKVGAGTYSKLHTIRRVPARQTFFFQVRAYVANQVQGTAGCRVNFHPEIQCIQSTRAGYMVRSRTVMVTVPAR